MYAVWTDGNASEITNSFKIFPSRLARMQKNCFCKATIPKQPCSLYLMLSYGILNGKGKLCYLVFYSKCRFEMLWLPALAAVLPLCCARACCGRNQSKSPRGSTVHYNFIRHVDKMIKCPSYFGQQCIPLSNCLANLVSIEQ